MTVPSLTSSTTPQPMGPPRGSGPQKTVAAVAEKLGMSTDDLTSALQSGSTMADLAKAAGVDQDDLVATIRSTLPAQGPDGAAVDTTQLATDIANGVRPGRGHGQQKQDKPEADLSQGVQALSGALGISSDDLLDRLTSGSGISDLLAADPQVSAQLSAMQNRGALVDGYA